VTGGLFEENRFNWSGFWRRRNLIGPWPGHTRAIAALNQVDERPLPGGACKIAVQTQEESKIALLDNNAESGRLSANWLKLNFSNMAGSP